MQVEELTITEKEAQQQLQALKAAAKQNANIAKEEVFRDFMRVYSYMRYGGKIIDVYESFKKAGLNADGDPRLAIARADAKQCYCVKRVNGGAIFADGNIESWQHPRKTHADVALPDGTFQWQLNNPNSPRQQYWNIKNPKIKTLVPIIPAQFLSGLKMRLRNYHILWEVEKWEPVPPRDPILLKRLTANLFAVLAAWKLSPLERAIVRGRI